ncbi:hypothetical protein EKG38_20165 [Shewanella canadensis]|uniref:Alkaline phytoceramidase n=1 Tax=Shewanella canadensis TaxID=271096 RepID=A0A3S0KYL5_9GAMM|nr:ceramidase domain-containing protein [Shewanella canadensis]RTR37250.1 hypothetical protein EKG38_20165 [Shewanella canadensis]
MCEKVLAGLGANLGRFWRLGVLIGIVSASVIWVFSLGVISQDTSYHLFADGRTLLLIPHLLNLISNLPFLLIGILGFKFCNHRERRDSHREWRIFFLGVGLVSLGSAYYHFNPTNASLLWDRLPMTLGFMALFTALIKEYLGERAGDLLFMPSLIIGLFSVIYWQFSGDLRLYYWVQLLPILTLPVVMILFTSRHSHQKYLLIALACYLLAKATEYFDLDIYLSTAELVSGHTIKHLLAAAACFCILIMLKKRSC